MTGTKVPAVSRNARGARTNSEEFLFTYPDILDVQVIGVPDLKYGEESMAWVRLRPDAGPLNAEGLRVFCANRIAHFKIPRYVHWAF